MRKALWIFFTVAAMQFCGDENATIKLEGQGAGAFYNYSCSNGTTFSHPFDGLAKDVS